MSAPFRPERIPLPSVSLQLSRWDWWRTHGALNVFCVFFSLPMLLLPVLFWFAGRWPSPLLLVGVVAAGAAALLGQQRVVRALFAIVSRRPFVTISDHGLAIDAGLFDRWSIPWSEIGAFAPDPDYLTKRLRDGHFTHFALRLSPTPARRFASGVQHSRFPDIFEISGRFARPSADELDVLAAHLRDKFEHFEPFLLSDL
jgi:hypothetical protein